MVPMERFNVHGGSVPLGHPFGATGARMVTTMAYELAGGTARTALLGICAAGGLGAAAVMGLGFALSWTLPALPRALFWAVAVLARLALLPMDPSDDIWRYLWEGGIQLQRLGENPLLLSANRALWIPSDSLMRFELGPQVRNVQHQISAQTATLQLDRDLLKLIGETKVERWSRPMALNGKGPEEAPEIQGTMKEVEWHPGTGELKAQGPVSMSRRPPKSATHRPPQLLKAMRLEGNTVKQEFTLFGPVDIDDPAERSWFRGAVLTFNTKEEWLTSASPFQAQKGELRVQGDELRLDGKSSLATIGQNCQLQQGGDGLQAQRCQWNWQTQAVKGEGQVRWNRQANDQLTRAERMEGRIGPKGHLEAITPGGRVVSQLRVPRRASAPQPQKPRPKPEPIVF
jgi:hypothetical protein